ncbi:hypothetical protein, partial [Xenorhabdus kozodoii]|uniref:hypothetical protein n=1 Tax=Xenorhabdus kozodoii TaxID=351676 RepID=UPI001ABF7639
KLLKSGATGKALPGCEAAYLTRFASGVKRLFSLSSGCPPRPVSARRRSVVAHYREFFGADNSFFENNYRLMDYTAKCRFIPTYTQSYQHIDISIKFIEHHANVFVTICEGKITMCFFRLCFEMLLRKPFFLSISGFSPITHSCFMKFKGSHQCNSFVQSAVPC